MRCKWRSKCTSTNLEIDEAGGWVAGEAGEVAAVEATNPVLGRVDPASAPNVAIKRRTRSACVAMTRPARNVGRG